MFLADGEAAFQEVFHVHLHVFPRTVGDGFLGYGAVAVWRHRRSRHSSSVKSGPYPRDVLTTMMARTSATSRLSLWSMTMRTPSSPLAS